MNNQSESPCVEGSAIWQAIDARLDGEEHRGEFVAPLTSLLHQIRERVDEATWGLILDLELRSGLEVMAGTEIGLELGYERGRATALLEAQHVPGTMMGKLADFLADTTVDYRDAMLALLAALQAAMTMAFESSDGWPALRWSRRETAPGHASLRKVST